MITHELKDLIRDRTDIVGLISEFIQLWKSGVNYVGLCPFHKEKTPSFHVSPSKGIYKCFGCGKSGDVIEFVKEFHGLPFNDALSFLGERCGIILESTNTKTNSMMQEIYEVLNYAMEFYNHQLMSSVGAKGLEYMKHREFEQLIDTFSIGYAGNDNGLYHALKDSCSIPALVNAGLIKSGNKRDFFKDRIMFPVRDYLGRVTGFSGRKLNNENNLPKYLNSPTTSVYDKSFALYGLYEAKNAIRLENTVYIVEGCTDVLSLHKAGIKNCVAVCGTSLTDSHLKRLEKYCGKAVIIFDGDNAGRHAVLRSLETGLNSGLKMRAVMLPEGEDPDSFSKRYGESLNEFLSQELNIVELVRKDLRPDIKDPDMEAEKTSFLIKTITGINDEVKKNAYLRHAGKIFGFNPAKYASVMKESDRKAKRSVHERQIVLLGDSFYSFPSTMVKDVEPEELNLFALLIRYPVVSDYVDFYLSDYHDIWSSDTAKTIFTHISGYLDNDKPLAAYSGFLEPFEYDCLSSLTLPFLSFFKGECNYEAVMDTLHSLLLRIELKNLLKEKGGIMSKKPSTDSVEEELEKIIARIELISALET